LRDGAAGPDGWVLRNRLRVDPALAAWRRFTRRLARRGIVWRDWEGPLAFAERAAAIDPAQADGIREIAALYAGLRYAPGAARGRPRPAPPGRRLPPMRHSCCLLLSLILTCSGLRARTTRQRDDVRRFIDDMQSGTAMERRACSRNCSADQALARVIKAIMPPRIREFAPGRPIADASSNRSALPPGGVSCTTCGQARRWPRRASACRPKSSPPSSASKPSTASTLGRFGTFAALTTLAFDYPPRADLFRRELEELLLLAREEVAARSPTRGSYAGAWACRNSCRPRDGAMASTSMATAASTSPSSVADAIGSVGNFLGRARLGKGCADCRLVTVAATVCRHWSTKASCRDIATRMAAAGVHLAKVGAGDTAISVGTGR
jgi:hypothetical protein